MSAPGRRASLMDFLKFSTKKKRSLFAKKVSMSEGHHISQDSVENINKRCTVIPETEKSLKGLGSELDDDLFFLSPGDERLRTGSVSILRSRTPEMRRSSGDYNKNCDSSKEWPQITKPHFQENVEVYNIGSDGVLESRECTRLKVEGKGFKPGSQVTALKPPESKNRIFRVSNMTVTTKGVQKHLTLAINLGPEFADGVVSVRALKDGSKLLLSVLKQEPLGDGSTFGRKYEDRFMLPFPINAEAISVSHQCDGERLEVEAPLLKTKKAV